MYRYNFVMKQCSWKSPLHTFPKKHVTNTLCFTLLLCGTIYFLSQIQSLEVIGLKGSQLSFNCSVPTTTTLETSHFVNLSAVLGKSSQTFHTPCSLRELMGKIITLECSSKTPQDAIIVEAGVAAGGSAIALAYAKRKSRRMHLYDTFEGMPPPSSRDGKDVHRRYRSIQLNKGRDDEYYGNIPNLEMYVRERFKKFALPVSENKVFFHRGLFQSTIPKEDNSAVMFLNVDGDWYDSVYTVMDRISPRVIKGGIIYIDDYMTYSGATNATDDFLEEPRNRDIWKIERAKCNGKLFLIRL